VQPFARRCEVVVRPQCGELAQQRTEGDVGGAARVRLRGSLDAVRQCEMALELVGQPRFADSWPADQANGAPATAGGAVPGLAE
jgi:hypothetical protein